MRISLAVIAKAGAGLVVGLIFFKESEDRGQQGLGRGFADAKGVGNGRGSFFTKERGASHGGGFGEAEHFEQSGSNIS